MRQRARKRETTIERPQQGPTAHAAQQVLLAAIDYYGSEAALGKAIGFSQNAVWRAKRLKRVSPRMAAKIEAVSKGRFKARRLCPDVFGTSSAIMARRWNGQAATQ